MKINMAIHYFNGDTFILLLNTIKKQKQKHIYFVLYLLFSLLLFTPHLCITYVLFVLCYVDLFTFPCVLYT